ncbi:MBL fold metallo-hydrolase [Paracoccus sediminis]|uniref:MBL fold metallo-hydrolase n=1 Tax=Paracoccus sediminis TaxID=1214787 RepID=UPI001A91F996|nr:MBL fold metallo-hydrolase [Paracoccus sediminis]
MSVTVHRGSAEIGGSCIEIRSASGQRLILDAGRPLDAPPGATGLLPKSLDLTGDATVLICHPHQDHWGLINELPARWEVMTGVASAKLIGITARFAQQPLDRELSTWSSRRSFSRGAFQVRPYLTDHSGFDAYMLLIEVDGRRILYSGDFRNHGRKGNLVDRLIAAPPEDVDVLIIEGTNLGTNKPTESEDELEARFVDLARRTAGRVFVTWSGQNIDRTVTLYRAASKSGRTLAVDLYTAEVLDALREHLSAPYLGIDKLKVVLTRNLVAYYKRLGREDWLAKMAQVGFGAADLERDNYIAMIRRGNLHRDYLAKGVVPTAEDAYSFSMWSGYLKDQTEMLDWFRSAGSTIKHIHTSGHASPATLRAFAAAISAKAVIPVHGSNWNTEQDGFGSIIRLGDAETFTI